MRIRAFPLACFAIADLFLFVTPLLESLDPTWFWGPFMVFFVVSALLETVFPSPPLEQKKRRVFRGGELRRLAEARRVTSIARRGGCGIIYSRIFIRGDHSGKMIGRCPGCGGELYVRSIRKVLAKMV